MKTPLVLTTAFLFLAGAPFTLAQSSGASLAREMTVNAEVQAEFFARYPDLADEQDTVFEAARQTAGEGREPSDRQAAAEALAMRARVRLSQRTPQEWQRKAVSLYPELGVAGSDFNQLFLRRYQEMKNESPQFAREASWPVLLAKRCADELRVGSPPASRPDAARAAEAKSPPAADGPRPAAKPRQSFWWSALSILLLAGALWLPARWLFRVSRAFAGGEEPVTLWQRALRPAAWTYLAVAFIALFRTFQANADLGFIDRFGITLLVSLLAGGVFAPVAFAIALGVVGWRRRAGARAALIRPSPPVETHRFPHEPAAK